MGENPAGAIACHSRTRIPFATPRWLRPLLIAGIGTLLVGRGTRAAGAGQAAYLVSDAVILSFPFLMLGLFYMASLSTLREARDVHRLRCSCPGGMSTFRLRA